MAQKAGYLLETGVCRAPQRILAISFKRDAARNLSRRLEARYPAHAGRLVSLTFDAFTKSILDRFGSSLPAPYDGVAGKYDLAFPTTTMVRDELYGIADLAPSARKLGAERVSASAARFIPEVFGGWQIPEQLDESSLSDEQWMALRWWQRILDSDEPKLDFTAINRLAELLVRTNASLRRAIRATYPMVFVDEFQDTTLSQYTLLETVFLNTPTEVTAVGDMKQRIMGFAGALPDAISRFESQFNAAPYQLQWNFRSTADLVALQGPVAELLTGEPQSIVSRALAEEGQVAAQIWSFPDAKDESERVAAWIAADIRQSGRRPADFAFLVKQKVAEFETRLVESLTRYGIPLRNDDRRYGDSGISLGDLLRQEVAELALGVIGLAIQPTGMSDTWIRTLELLDRARGITDNELGRRTSTELLQRHTRHLRSWLSDHQPGLVPSTEVVAEALSLVDENQLEALSAYSGAERYDSVTDALNSRMDEVVVPGLKWSEAFHLAVGDNAASIMTIHRSKGLEYHTVIILGLDDDQWWSNRSDPTGTLSAFFVGLSRAAHRLIITRATARAGGSNTKTFYELLADAGIRESSPEE